MSYRDDFIALVDERITEADDSNDYDDFIALVDELCDKLVHATYPANPTPGYLSADHLTNLQADLQNLTGKNWPKFVLFNHEGYRLGQNSYDLKRIDAVNYQLTLFESIPLNKFYKYYFY